MRSSGQISWREPVALIGVTMRSAVAWSLAATALRLGGVVLVLPIVLRHLPVEQLGLWYVFLSISSIVGLMDAGFGPTVVRAIGYLWSGAEKLLPHGLADVRNDGSESGKPNYKLMADLVATMSWYYRAIGLLVLLGLAGGGSFWIWRTTAGFHDAFSIRGAWLLFCIGMMVNMAAAIWGAALMGINGVRLSQQLFTYALVLNYIIVVAGLLLGWGLWAMVAGQFVQGFVARVGGKLGFLTMAGPEYRAQRGRPTWQLVKTLWPMSWRTALMGLGAYLILNSNTLVCSTFLGLEKTASYGLTFQLVSAVVGIAAIWLNVKLPLMNQWRAAGETARLARLFIERLRLSLATYLAGALGLIVAGAWFVQIIGSKTPLLPVSQTGALLLVMLLNMHHAVHEPLVLSQNRNPFVMPLLLTGASVAVTSLIAAPHLGTWGLVLSIGLAQLGFNNWWIVLEGLKSLNLTPSAYFRELIGIKV